MASLTRITFPAVLPNEMVLTKSSVGKLLVPIPAHLIKKYCPGCKVKLGNGVVNHTLPEVGPEAEVYCTDQPFKF